jgi:UDP-glucose 4-epimerase
MNNLAHVMAISIVGLIGEEKKSMEKIIPYLLKTESGRIAHLEIFSRYVGNFFN